MPCTTTPAFSQALALLMLIGVLHAPNAWGQTCPFMPAEAVADTLDAAGYLALEVGQRRDYVEDEGGFLVSALREDVVADTVIDGIAFHRVRQIRYALSLMGEAERADTSFHVVGLDAGLLVTWDGDTVRPQRGRYGLPVADFSRPFQSCYEAIEVVDEDRTVVLLNVAGGYGGQYTFRRTEGTVVFPEAVKTFEAADSFSGDSYGHGLGRLTSFTEAGITEQLAYVRSGAVELGTPIDSLFALPVAIDPRPRSRLSAMHLFPNPAQRWVRVVVEAQAPTQGDLVIYDLLGRHRMRLAQSVYVSPGQTYREQHDLGTLEAGVYVLVFVPDQHPPQRQVFTLIR